MRTPRADERRKPPRSRLRGTLLLPAFLLAVPVHAPAQSERNRPDEEIVVRGFPWDYRSGAAETATKRPQDIMDTAAAVQVVPQAVIRDQQALSLDHVLTNVSGTGFVDGGEGVQIFSRGFTAATFKNGFPLTEFTDGDVQRSHLDTYNIERVEVLKGPASVLYGRGNPGGTINLITKQPLRMPAIELGLMLGTDDARRRSSLDATGPVNDDGSLRYRVTAFYESDDPFRDVVESEEHGIAPSLAYDFSEDTTAALAMEFTGLESVPDGGLPGSEGDLMPGVAPDTFLGEPSDRNEDDRRTARLRVDHELANGWTLKTVARTERSDSSTAYARPDAVLDDGRTAGRGSITSAFGLDDYRLQAELTGQLRTGRLDHSLVAGLEIARRDTEVLFAGGPIDGIDIFEPAYGAEPGDPFFTFVSHGERELAGLFVQDQMSFDDRWHVVLGGRFDSVEQRVTSGLLGNTSEQPRKRDDAFSPNAGLVYRPFEQLSWYVSWGNSFQTHNGVPVNAAGEVLEPEQARLYESGVKLSVLEDRLGGTVAFYRIDKEHARTPDLANPGFQMALGEVRSQGVELDVAGTIRPRWRVIAAYAYNDAEVLRDSREELLGNRPKEMPTHSANVWTTYELASGPLAGLGFGGGITYVGDRPGDDANTFELSGYSRVDASIFYRQPRFTARLNLYNLLDEEYVANMARGSFVRPGEPLHARASVQLSF